MPQVEPEAARGVPLVENRQGLVGGLVGASGGKVDGLMGHLDLKGELSGLVGAQGG